jgi:pimeloyl-ACP methyl ester carboxylesterase/DNA-binding CsgD family transcriptional regulator
MQSYRPQSYRTQQIRFCTSRDGTRIAYAISGTGPPMVRAAHWINHLKLDWDSPFWRPMLSALMRHHTLIRYDLRGAGLSDRDGVDISLEKHVEDLEAVVEAAGVDYFPLFAVTGGTHIAMRYAVRHPGRVSHLILYASASRGRLARAAGRDSEEADAQLKLIEFGWSSENPAFRQLHTTQFMPEATPEQSQAFTELMRHTTSPTTAAALLRAFWSVDNREIAPRIQCPTLVLHPRSDPRIPFEQGRLLAGLIPRARFAPLESGNHLLLENEPAWRQFIDEIDDFLPPPPRQSSGTADPAFDGLTGREHDVLELVAQGLDNDSIGSLLGTSAKTVRNQVSTIFSKLGVNSRAQAIVRAREAGFGRKMVR